MSLDLIDNLTVISQKLRLIHISNLSYATASVLLSPEYVADVTLFLLLHQKYKLLNSKGSTNRANWQKETSFLFYFIFTFRNRFFFHIWTCCGQVLGIWKSWKNMVHVLDNLNYNRFQFEILVICFQLRKDASQIPLFSWPDLKIFLTRFLGCSTRQTKGYIYNSSLYFIYSAFGTAPHPTGAVLALILYSYPPFTIAISRVWVITTCIILYTKA